MPLVKLRQRVCGLVCPHNFLSKSWNSRWNSGSSLLQQRLFLAVVVPVRNFRYTFRQIHRNKDLKGCWHNISFVIFWILATLSGAKVCAVGITSMRLIIDMFRLLFGAKHNISNILWAAYSTFSWEFLAQASSPLKRILENSVPPQRPGSTLDTQNFVYQQDRLEDLN